MHRKREILAGLAVLAVGTAAWSQSAVIGGKVYDNWWKTAGVATPAADQPLWATQSTNTRSGSTTWRCKECHGWDYKGAEGAYGSGSHFTGFAGVLKAGSSLSAPELLARLDGTAQSDHDFSAMGPAHLSHLVEFLSTALIDVGPYIDARTKAAVGGDRDHGQSLYSSTCAGCHGADGRTINFQDPAEPEFVGTIAAGNPWEFIHKVRFGQPAAAMPAGVDMGWRLEDVIDVLDYAQTLPTGPAGTTAVAVSGWGAAKKAARSE